MAMVLCCRLFCERGFKDLSFFFFFSFFFFKVKIHFWFLHFGPIFILVPNFILLLFKFLKIQNQFYFGLCRQLTNKKLLHCK